MEQKKQQNLLVGCSGILAAFLLEDASRKVAFSIQGFLNGRNRELVFRARGQNFEAPETARAIAGSGGYCYFMQVLNIAVAAHFWAPVVMLLKFKKYSPSLIRAVSC
jgi:hypothetical protein